MNVRHEIFLLFVFLFAKQRGIVCPTVTCDFEIDQCNWQMDSSWRLYPSGSTPDTASSGPTVDHTTGSGNYARFMALSLTDNDQYGTMATNVSLTEPTFFSFWFYMHGSQIGTLTFLANDQILWQKSKRQGVPAWYQANLTIPAASEIELVFSANRSGLGRSSDIAIDDLFLDGEPMTTARTTPSRTTTTPRTRYNASCDFDVDKELCGWKSDTKYGWKVINQRESDISIGPMSDYSSIKRANNDGKFCQIPFDDSGTQYYCVLKSKNLQCKGSDNKFINCRDGGFVQIRTGMFDEVGERSQFESLVLNAGGSGGCIQFQYNIAGTDGDWLQVYVEDYWTNIRTCMWHKNETTIPNQWVTAEAPLNLTDNDRYKILFEARKGLEGGLGVVSLDHLVISSQPCSGSYPVTECPYEETTTTTTTTTTSTTTTSTTSTTTTSTTTTTTTTTSTTSTTSTITTSTTESTTTTETTTTSTISSTSTSTSTSSTTTTTTTTTTITVLTTQSSSSTPMTLTSIPVTTTSTKTVTEAESTTSTTSTRTSTPPPVITTSTSTESKTSMSTDIEIPQSTTKPSSSVSPGAVAGIIIGVLVVVAIVAVVLFKWYQQRSRGHGNFRRSDSRQQITFQYRPSAQSDGSVYMNDYHGGNTNA